MVQFYALGSQLVLVTDYHVLHQSAGHGWRGQLRYLLGLVNARGCFITLLQQGRPLGFSDHCLRVLVVLELLHDNVVIGDRFDCWYQWKHLLALEVVRLRPFKVLFVELLLLGFGLLRLYVQGRHSDRVSVAERSRLDLVFLENFVSMVLKIGWDFDLKLV